MKAVFLQITQGMTNEQRFFLMLLTIFILTIVSSLVFTNNYLAPAIFSMLMFFAIGISRPLWQPSLTPNRIRFYSLVIAMSVALAALLGRSWLQQVLETFLIPSLNAKFDLHLQINNYSEWSFVPVLIFVFGVILIVNWFARDAPAMGSHSAPITAEFPERNYNERLRLLCEELGDHLSRINSETNWSHRHFISLVD